MRTSKGAHFLFVGIFFCYFYKQLEVTKLGRTLNRVYVFIKNIFSYSYSEARGFVALLLVSLMLLFIIFFPKYIIRNQIQVDPA